MIATFQYPYVDRSRNQKSKAMKAFLDKHPNIHVEDLPAYAPERNSEECYHGNVRRRMKNAVLRSKTQIRCSLDQSLLSAYGNGHTLAWLFSICRSQTLPTLVNLNSTMR